MAACLYDALVLTAVEMGAAAAWIAAVRHAVEPGDPAFQAYLLAVAAIFFCGFWRRGETLGMRAWRLRVVGTDGEVLVEGPSRKGLPQLCGRSPGNHVINIEDGAGRFRAGDLIPVRVTRAGRHSLAAEPIQRATPPMKVTQCSSR
jgi:hypothetical protein